VVHVVLKSMQVRMSAAFVVLNLSEGACQHS